MEAETDRKIGLWKGCSIRGCFDEGIFRISIKIPEGTLDITGVTFCAKHVDQPDLPSMILKYPGIADDLKRQMEPYGIELPPASKMLVIAERIPRIVIGHG